MKKIAILLLMAVSVSFVKAEDVNLTKYKSLFTLNFIRYIGWSDEAKQGDFVIGVLNNKELASQLSEQNAGKKFGYQDIVVKSFNSVAEITSCQILYAGEGSNYARNAAAINGKLDKGNSVVITESDGAISSGSVINFVVVDSKLKFEVSTANAEKQGVKLSSSLLAMNNAIKK